MKPLLRYAGKVSELRFVLQNLRGDETPIQVQQMLRGAEAKSLLRQILEAHNRKPSPRSMLTPTELQCFFKDLIIYGAVHLCSYQRAMHLASMAALKVPASMTVSVEKVSSGWDIWAVRLKKAETRA